MEKHRMANAERDFVLSIKRKMSTNIIRVPDLVLDSRELTHDILFS